MDTLIYMLNRAAELNAPIPEGLQDKRMTIAGTLNIRRGPGITCPVTGSLKAGYVVNVVEEAAGWARIGFDEWVSAQYLRKI